MVSYFGLACMARWDGRLSAANDIKCRFVVVGHINQQKATAKSESSVDMALSADTGATEHETIGLVSRLWSHLSLHISLTFGHHFGHFGH